MSSKTTRGWIRRGVGWYQYKQGSDVLGSVQQHSYNEWSVTVFTWRENGGTVSCLPSTRRMREAKAAVVEYYGDTP